MEELSKSLKRRKSLSASVRSIRIYSAMTMMDGSEHYYFFALVVGISIHQNQTFFFWIPRVLQPIYLDDLHHNFVFITFTQIIWQFYYSYTKILNAMKMVFNQSYIMLTAKRKASYQSIMSSKAISMKPRGRKTRV